METREPKERPILFSGPNSDPDHFCIHAATNVNGERVDKWIPCPYGKKGDRLWVRETWYDNLIRDEGDYRLVDEHGSALVVYRADGEFYDQFEEVEGDPKWRPSIFMPRWASRILLEVVSVRVERLQEITPADAMAEGCPHPPDGYWTEQDAVSWYGNLWDIINGRGAWCSNPWVWVIEFKRGELLMGGETRLPREQVLPIALSLYRALEPACDKICIAGSLRREEPTVGDIEIVAVPKHLLHLNLLDELEPEAEPSQLLTILRGLICDGVLVWPEKNKANGPSLKRLTVVELGIPIEIYLCDEYEYGYITMIRTGPADFAEAMVTEWTYGGLKMPTLDCKGGAKRLVNGKWQKLDLPNEKAVFDAWGLPVLHPRERDAAGVEKLRGMVKR